MITLAIIGIVTATIGFGSMFYYLVIDTIGFDLWRWKIRDKIKDLIK